MRQLYDSAGQVVANRRYEPFGSLLSASGTGESVYGFAGEQLDASTGLVYLRTRYLDTGVGRFTQVDPSAWEANPYLYAGANPANYTDPRGLCSQQAMGAQSGSGYYVLRRLDPASGLSLAWVDLTGQLCKAMPGWAEWWRGFFLQYTNDLTVGFTGYVYSQLNYETLDDNTSVELQRGREAGRKVAAVQASIETVGGAAAAAAAAEAGPLTAGTAAAAALPSGGVVTVGGVAALTAEGVVVVVGTGVAAHGATSAAFMRANPVSSGANKDGRRPWRITQEGAERAVQHSR